MLLLVFAISGCAYFQPYASLDAKVISTDPKYQASTTKELDATIDSVQATIQDISLKRDELTAERRALNLITFGLAVGAVGAGVHGAHAGTIAALGLGSVTTYEAASLFFPADQVTLYISAQTALSCIAGKGRALSGAAKNAQQAKGLNGTFLLDEDAIGMLIDKAKLDDVSSCTAIPPTGKTEEQISPLKARAELAKQSAMLARHNVITLDSLAANKVRQAAGNVIQALNKEIDQRSASSEAILQAARSTLSLASGITTQPILTKSTGTVVPGAAIGIAVTNVCYSAELPKALAALERQYEQFATALNDALNSLDSLDTACVSSAPPAVKLSVTPQNAIVTKDSHFNLTISGGKAPYAISWSGEAPKGVDAELIPPNTITLIGTSAIGASPADKPFSLQVSDSSAVQNIQTITVQLK
jgi:hypothetical protein